MTIFVERDAISHNQLERFVQESCFSETSESLFNRDTLCGLVDDKSNLVALAVGSTVHLSRGIAELDALVSLPSDEDDAYARRTLEEFERIANRHKAVGVRFAFDSQDDRARCLLENCGYRQELFCDVALESREALFKFVNLTVLVTAIGSFSARVAIESLKQMGARVIGCDIYPKEWVVNSRDVDVFYNVPLVCDEKAYLDALNDILDKENVSVLLPSTDYEIDVLMEHRDEVAALITMSSTKALSICRDKLETYKHLLPSFESFLIDTKDALSVCADEIDCPCVCKPNGGRSSQGLHKITEKKELETFFQEENLEGYCIQPLIEGDIITVDIARQLNGDVVVCIPRKEWLRTSNGAGTSVEILPFNEEFQTLCKDIARTLEVVGCVNFEFIVGKDGNYRFLECNPRLAGGVAFSQIAGYDFVKNHVKAAMGMCIQPLNGYASGFIARRYEEYVM